MDDLVDTLRMAMMKQRIVNIPLLAEEIRQRNEADNVALEDIEAQLMTRALFFDVAMEFDTSEMVPSCAAN
jgi:hypothetical protein